MARRVVLIVLGGLLLVIGVLAAIGGGALMALFGSNDTLSSGVQQVPTRPARWSRRLARFRAHPARRPPWAASGCVSRPRRPGRASALPGHRPGERGGLLSQRCQPRRGNRRVRDAVSADAGPPRRHRHTATARIPVVLGGQGQRKPSDPDVDRYFRLLPGGRDEHRRCRPGGLRRRAGSAACPRGHGRRMIVWTSGSVAE